MQIANLRPTGSPKYSALPFQQIQLHFSTQNWMEPEKGEIGAKMPKKKKHQHYYGHFNGQIAKCRDGKNEDEEEVNDEWILFMGKEGNIYFQQNAPFYLMNLDSDMVKEDGDSAGH
jgi:hypothetical protein